jgi:uncharacterized protein
MNVEEWKKKVETARKHKDFFFASHPQSPLASTHRIQFKGLAYWPPDLNYRFILELIENDVKETLQVNDTAGQTRKFLCWGTFHFQVDGLQCLLEAYKSGPEENRLFIPFRDETSGKQSYGAGRYLDLDQEQHVLDNGKWILDFNEAYNPWCAYSDAYACPFVPAQNWLKAPICAGEQKYPLK